MKRLLVSLFLLAAFIAGSGTAQVSSEDLLKADPSNWLTYSGAYHAQRHTLLDQINTGNVKNLTAKWIFHFSDVGHMEAVPIVVDGVMYLGQFNRVDAVDARTGRLIWQYQREPAATGWHRGVAVYGNKVYVGTRDAYVVALDARTGGVVWETKIPGESPRYQGAAPLVVKGKVIVGSRDRRGGTIDAYDAETGKHVWRWNAIPKAGEPGAETWAGESWKLGGGPTWLTGSYDPALNLIYWGTGQPGLDFDGDSRKGDNLYTNCMVALDPDTGEMKWYFQFTPHDIHDYDAVEIPILVDAAWKGEPRKLLVQANRNGYYYILDRTNGKFLQGTPFVNKITWARGLTEDGRPVVVPEAAPTPQGTKVCPSTAGATNWPSPAYSPDTNLFYLISQEGCGFNFKITTNFDLDSPRSPGNGTGYTERSEEQEQWELHVIALNLTSGEKVWDYKQIGSRHYGPGVLSTAGGIVFAGEYQGHFTALDARNGKPLWHFNTGDLIWASPMSYTVNGKQYVAITAGTNVVAFGLPD
jgi:alcohol dehydrogenase (cytochrome c)